LVDLTFLTERKFWKRLLNKQNQICHSTSFSLENVMRNSTTFREWQIRGLPSDQLFETKWNSHFNIKKGVSSDRFTITRSELVDGTIDLKILRMNSGTLLKDIENAIRVDNSVLIEDLQ
jgi:hypothetical protein